MPVGNAGAVKQRQILQVTVALQRSSADGLNDAGRARNNRPARPHWPAGGRINIHFKTSVRYCCSHREPFVCAHRVFTARLNATAHPCCAGRSVYRHPCTRHYNRQKSQPNHAYILAVLRRRRHCDVSSMKQLGLDGGTIEPIWLPRHVS